MKLAIRLGLTLVLIALGVAAAVAQPAGTAAKSPEVTVAVEVFPVLELPVAIDSAVLVKTKGGYLLRCSLSNSSEFRQLGMRYSLAVLDGSEDVKRRVITLSEGFSLPPFQSDEVTFTTPLRLKLKGSERLVLMLQQLISTDYVWDVLNPKESFTGYLTGDYSITPQVLRVRNQVDTRPMLQILY
jgi:hypothetical protein